MNTNWFYAQASEFDYPQPEEDFGYLQKTYDTSNGCLTCGIGITQKNEFYFKKNPLKNNKDFLGLTWVFDQIFIKENVKKIFENEGVNGISYTNPINIKTNKPIENFYQIRVNNYLSKGLITENLTTELCEYPKSKEMISFLKALSKGESSRLLIGPFCAKKKFNMPNRSNPFIINSKELTTTDDFIKLDYPFGSGGVCMQPILVSEKVKTIIENEQLKGLDLIKIELR